MCVCACVRACVGVGGCVRVCVRARVCVCGGGVNAGFCYLSMVVLAKYYSKMENVNYLVITKQIHNISVLSSYLQLKYKLSVTC